MLGIVQVALGLTLYGSPKYLFILYALWGFFLLFLYFFLCFHFRVQTGFDDGSSYYTGYNTEVNTEVTEDRRSRRHGPGLGSLAAAGAAGAGLAALRRRSRSRRRSRDDGSSSRRTSESRHRSESRVHEKLHGDHGGQKHTWRDRLLGVGAGLGALAAARSLFNRGKGRDGGSEASHYHRPVGGASSVTQTDLSRVEEGFAPSSPGRDRDHWRRVEEREAAQAAAMSAAGHSRRPTRHRRSGDSIDSISSYTSLSRDDVRHNNLGLKEGIAALGLAGFLRSKFKQRRKRKEDVRVDEMRRQEIEQERLARANSERRRYTGDGTPRRGGRRSSVESSALHGSTPQLSRHNRTDLSIPAPPLSSHAGPTMTEPSIIPVPPAPADGIHHESGSEEYFSSGGRPHHRHHLGAEAAAAGAGAALAAKHRDTSRQRSSGDASVNSPPVSVKVKMHNDGRHVTLRRLNEEEAAAEREARRRERHRRNRNGSLSSVGEGGSERWRRVEAMEAAQAEQAHHDSASANAPIPMPPPPPVFTAAPSHGAHEELHLPPPPPIPGSTMGGSVGSPGGTTPYDTGTEMSRPSTYDANRRRRRAERSAAQRAKGGNRVEFE